MRISVIIPTLNEADCIAETIVRTRELDPHEIIVADGGSSDDTLACSQAADHIVTSPRGRGTQQNAGAAIATGDVLLFLHADCTLEPAARPAIRDALSDPRCLAGCFRQAIDAPGLRYRLLEWGNALRVRTLGWAYGDQGIFVRRETFESVGGFPDVPLMEDLLLMKRLRPLGRPRLLDHRLRVSPRRWRKSGVLRQTLRNWSFVALAHLGVSPDHLAGRYADVR